MADDFKPCPFCGGTLLSTVFTHLSATVCCQQCGAAGPEQSKRQTMEQAAEAWNRRILIVGDGFDEERE